MSTLNNFRSIEPTFAANVPSQKSPRFLFVTISNPDEIRDPAKQTTIRRHAKRDADRMRKTSRKVEDESLTLERRVKQAAVSYTQVLRNDSVEQPQSKQKNQEADAMYYTTEMLPVADHDISPERPSNNSSSLAFLRPLGAGLGFNPLAPYPIESGSRNAHLLDYMLQAGELQQRPMRAIWITIAMSDSSAFHITLAHAAFLPTKEYNQSPVETTESIKHYTASVHAVSKRLQDPVDSISDGVIGAILGLTCLDINIGNWDRWQLHMEGLQRILQLRGGAESLQTSYILEMTAFWNDVTGSLVLDAVPRFPVPQYLIRDPESLPSSRIFIFSQKWNTRFPNLSDISDGLSSLASLASDIDKQKTNNGQWQQELFIAIKAHPVAHKLLSISRFTVDAETNVSSSGSLIREILRLTSLLFIGLVKDYCNVFPTGVPENKLRLERLFSEIVVDWSSFMDLRLWVLTVSGLAEKGERGWYVREVISAMKYLGLTAWNDALKILKELIWVSEMLDIAADAFGSEVTTSLVTGGSFEPSGP